MIGRKSHGGDTETLVLVEGNVKRQGAKRRNGNHAADLAAVTKNAAQLRRTGCCDAYSTEPVSLRNGRIRVIGWRHDKGVTSRPRGGIDFAEHREVSHDIGGEYTVRH